MLNDLYDISPSNEGLALVKALVPDAEFYLRLARTGSHHLNPYHNLKHELATCYWAYSCYVNSSWETHKPMPTVCERSQDIRRVLLSSLFHDHNHSGGRELDSHNVGRALDFVTHAIDSSKIESTAGQFGFTMISKAIECTEFTNGRFPKSPSSIVGRCLRDADLMSIYSIEGRRLLLGLLQELDWKIETEDQVVDIMERQTKFLNEAIMYTSFGCFMKQHYLKDALDAFAYLLRSRLPKTRPPAGSLADMVLTNAGAELLRRAASSGEQDGK